jgi:phosphatidylserine/phosphatidylglycerophosphate/cardiolipin synthase-like enzyme
MSKFLNTTATNYFLEEIIKNSKDRLVLISPYLKLNDRMKELLQDKDRLKIDIRIIYGKNELHPSEINWLNGLTYVRTSFCKNLHAKCYLNESQCIVTSMNLYEFSQINNNEMGILLDKDDDKESYKDAYEEALRIIRISEEVKITLERVEQSDAENEELIEQSGKVSSSKVALKHKLKTQIFIDKLIKIGYLSNEDNKLHLTELGKNKGGEFKYSPRFGAYFIWPDNLEF